MVVAQQELTLQDFLLLPEKKPALEYAEGRITRKVSPKARHSRLQTDLAEWFNRHGRRRRLALASTELRTTFGGRSYVPDLVVFRWERIPLDARGQVLDDVYIPPDIVVEIRSPGQSRSRLIKRCQWYVAHGVPLAVLVDPRDWSIVLCRPGAAPETLMEADEIDFSTVLPFPRLSVQHVFALLQLGSPPRRKSPRLAQQPE